MTDGDAVHAGEAWDGAGFATRAIHVGQAPEPGTGAINTPLYLASTYAQASPGVTRGYAYSRSGNPTRRAYEDCLASLEAGTRGFAFASGLAATTTVLGLLSQGDHVIACHDIYGGSMRLFDRVLARFGMGFDYVDLADPAALTAALRPETRMLWIESPTNPLLQLLDIRALCERAHAAGLIVVVDNTFMSPYFQRPLELGADVVVHSTTKYIGGHSDLVGGAAIVRDADLGDRIAFLSNAMGGVQATFDAWLCLRSLKTLAVRMRAHEANAFAVARFLEAHPEVEDVRYPGLPSHPQHALAQAQMHGFGGMIAARVRGDLAQATRLLESVRVFTLAESLGGVESLIEHPAIMTHASMPAEVRRANGIDDGLLRISVGLEDADDLVSDLAQALAAAAATA